MIHKDKTHKNDPQKLFTKNEIQKIHKNETEKIHHNETHKNKTDTNDPQK